MLIQFTVENYLSFKQEVILNMIPAKSRTMKDHIIEDENGKKIQVLPILTIYGANASGKSNLVKALGFMQNLILEGTRSRKMTGVEPHLLDNSYNNGCSRFELIFKYNDILYTYGFLASVSTIEEEWLFAYFSTQESKIFERITKKDNTVIVDPGPKLITDAGGREFLKYVEKGTRPNQLFLTEATDKNIEILKPVIHWFTEFLNIVYPDARYRSLVMRAHKDENFIEYMSKFLNVAGTGIEKLICETEEFDSKKHLQEIPVQIREKILEDLNDKMARQIILQTSNSTINISRGDASKAQKASFIRLKSQHRMTDGSNILFDIGKESDGTRRLMDLAPMLTDIVHQGRVYVIDEMDRSLHTHLSKLFLETCLTSAINKKAKGQIIMTTHDTNLLDRNLLRKDEIYFIEKDLEGASHLTSLAEYKISEGLNYENGYLNGRFGAIPFFGNVESLMAD